MLTLTFTSTEAHGNMLLDPFLTRDARVHVSTAEWIAYPLLIVATMVAYSRRPKS
jgi:hypothetical protein